MSQNENEFKCSHCENIYKTKNGLQKHIRQNHQIFEDIKQEKQHACKLCYKVFRTRQTKWSHEQKCKTINEVPLAEQVKNLSAEVKELRAKPLTNIINNNTTNNIQYVIKPLGTESIEHLTTEKQREIMQKGLNSLTYLIQVNNFNKDKPENHSYCVTALNDKHASVINPDTNTIVKADKNELFDKMLITNLANLENIAMNKNFTITEKKEYEEKIQILKDLLFRNRKGMKKYYSELNILSYNNKDIVLETWASLKSLDKLIEPENNMNTIEFNDEDLKDNEEIKDFEEDSDEEINKKRLEFGKIMCPNTKIKIIKYTGIKNQVVPDKYANDSGSELSDSDTDSDTESVEDAEIKIKNTTYIIEGNKLYLKLEAGKGAFYGTYSNGKVKKANKNIEL
jgi:hypothetical protein